MHIFKSQTTQTSYVTHRTVRDTLVAHSLKTWQWRPGASRANAPVCDTNAVWQAVTLTGWHANDRHLKGSHAHSRRYESLALRALRASAFLTKLKCTTTACTGSSSKKQVFVCPQQKRKIKKNKTKWPDKVHLMIDVLSTCSDLCNRKRLEFCANIKAFDQVC